MSKLLSLIPVVICLALLAAACWWPSLVPVPWRAAIGWVVLTVAPILAVAYFVMGALASHMRS